MKKSKVPQKYIDPVMLSKLGNLELIARCAVEGFFTGLHPSPFHGFSVEYSEHRAYQWGDELKYLDWKKYGRSDKLYVKQFQQETNVNVYLMLDSSKSMSFKGDYGISKMDFGCYLAAALSYIMLKQNDSVGLSIFNNKLNTWIPPKSCTTQLNLILKTLQKNEPAGQTDLASVLHTLAERSHRRGIVILISDLLDNIEDIKSGLAHLKYLKHDVIVLHTLHSQELKLDYDEQVLFEDLESGLTTRVFPRSIQKAYQQNVQKYLDEIRYLTGVNEIDYYLLNTSEPMDKGLMAYMNRRRRMG